MHLSFNAIRTVTFFETILSTLRVFTSTPRTALFFYYYAQARKTFLVTFTFFYKEAFQLASVHSQISPVIAGMYLKLTKWFHSKTFV